MLRRAPRVVGSLEHDLPQVTGAVPEPHQESRHQHPQKSFDLLSEEFTLLRPLLLSDDVDVRRVTSCDLVVSDELLVSRHRPRAFANETWARRARRRRERGGRARSFPAKRFAGVCRRLPRGEFRSILPVNNVRRARSRTRGACLNSRRAAPSCLITFSCLKRTKD